MSTYVVEEIIWEDAVGESSEWISVDDARALSTAEIVTVGIILRETAKEIVHINTLSSDEKGTHGAGVIPQGMVRKRTKIAEVEIPPKACPKRKRNT